jgi:hypothetical protein
MSVKQIMLGEVLTFGIDDLNSGRASADVHRRLPELALARDLPGYVVCGC